MRRDGLEREERRSAEGESEEDKRINILATSTFQSNFFNRSIATFSLVYNLEINNNKVK